MPTKGNFLGGYKTYDPKKEGYGNPKQWKGSFKKRMSFEEAEEIIKDDDPYSILGVKRSSTLAEVKSAFRKLAMEFHPDKHPGEEQKYTAKMQQIIAAYTILKERL